ncbi:segregation/condensation protein A [Streptomyces sp. NPDC059402]|uniref:segregation/condensation protein A n=1 Tax=Streptomyces sp. NPDC059402 TaxID=3346822 RepID=UPI0036A18443
MTSNDAPHPGRTPRAGRRRALGRGPGEPTAPPVTEGTPYTTGTSGADAAEQDLRPGPAPAPSRAPGAQEREPGTSGPCEHGTPGASSGTEPDPAGPAVGSATEPPGTDAEALPTPERAPGEADREGSEPVERPVEGPVPATVTTAPGDPTGARTRAGASEAAGPGDFPPGGDEEASGERGEGGGGTVYGPAGATRDDEAADAAGATGDGEAADDGEAAGDGVFKVRLANFEGPFDLLLQLISKHKMDVTEVALSKVTDEFMAHIRAMGPDWDLDQTTEFLVVAATLLDLKAARLLPAAEVEDEADLALLEARDLLFARLLQYRAYKQIAEIFNDRLAAEARRYPRTVGLEAHHAELLPEVVISIGPEGFAKLAVKAMQPKPKPQVYVEHIHAPLVSVQEQAGIVVARLKELGEASFRVLVQDTEDTLTVVARFLALLELYREKVVELDQETALGDLLVRWTGGDGETRPVVTDEFDRPPEAPKEEQKA